MSHSSQPDAAHATHADAPESSGLHLVSATALRFDPAIPVSQLRPSTRLWNILQRRGVCTLGELLALHPDDLARERNCGRQTMQNADQLIHSVTGLTWREARAQLYGDKNETSEEDEDSANEHMLHTQEQARRWSSFAMRLAPLASTPLCALTLPARLFSFAEARDVSSLGALLRVPWEEFATARNIGRLTISQVLDQLEELAANLENSEHTSKLSFSIDHSESWLKLLIFAVGRLEQQTRIIVTRRLHLGVDERATLEQIGEEFGVTRERIRQLEQGGLQHVRQMLPTEDLITKLDQICPKKPAQSQ